MKPPQQLRTSVQQHFWERFGEAPQYLVRAPGRVNLIGEHTDYNDGFVLPLAIDRGVWIALRASSDRRVALHSLDFNERQEFSLDDATLSTEGWMQYVQGVALVLAARGHRLHGWDGIIAGDVPIGAGLSSSAAIELAAARALTAVARLPWHPLDMALAAQRAENTWIGVNCGIMDQLISAAGQAESALLIDCRSLEARPVPIPENVSVIVLDTATRRGLVDSAYNERRTDCEAAARFLGVRALRDVDVATFEALAGRMDLQMRKRARHVVHENARTLAAADALCTGDVLEVGRLMKESHASLRDDFEVSRAELDAMVDIACAQYGCLGARMTGAGFGGCAVALVEAAATPEFVARTALEYEQRLGLVPKVYVCNAAQGASIEPGEPLPSAALLN